MNARKKKTSLKFLFFCILYVTFLIVLFDTMHDKSSIFLQNDVPMAEKIYAGYVFSQVATVPVKDKSDNNRAINEQIIEVYTCNNKSKIANKHVPIQRKSVPYKTNAFSYPLDINFQEVIANYTQGKKINAPVINPHPFETIYEPEVCRDPESTKSKLLIIVKSSAPNGMLRNAIRHTWGANLSEIGVELYFSVGLARKEQVNKDVNVEQEQYRDILLEDFYDSYFNVTYKTIMGFNWAVKHCNHIKYILFVDDDHIVYVKSVLEYTTSVSPDKAKGFFEGFLLGSSMPFRDEKSKWYISVEDYPYNRWPPYLAGGAYLISSTVAQQFVIAFPYIKSMTIDDSWLGIVAKKLNIKPVHNSSFKNRAVMSQKNCFASHGFKDPAKMYRAWKSIK